MRVGKDETYMDVAEAIGRRSSCDRAKVGAIIVKDDNIIAMGYNGTPSGFDNVCEIDNVTKREVLHAESNAIAKCARSVNSSENSTMYCTMMPCFDCAKLIIQCGILAVYYRYEYRDASGVTLLRKAGITVEQIKTP